MIALPGALAKTARGFWRSGQADQACESLFVPLAWDWTVSICGLAASGYCATHQHESQVYPGRQRSCKGKRPVKKQIVFRATRKSRHALTFIDLSMLRPAAQLVLRGIEPTCVLPGRRVLVRRGHDLRGDPEHRQAVFHPSSVAVPEGLAWLVRGGGGGGGRGAGGGGPLPF